MIFGCAHEQLRQLCRNSSEQVSIEPTNIWDSLYRASVNFVLDACSRCDLHSHASASLSLLLGSSC